MRRSRWLQRSDAALQLTEQQQQQQWRQQLPPPSSPPPQPQQQEQEQEQELRVTRRQAAESQVADGREAEHIASDRVAANQVREMQLRLLDMAVARQDQVATNEQEAMEWAAAAVTSKNDEELCVVCFENARTHLVFPCGHMCICDACVPLIAENCPLCRGPKQGVCRVFR